MKKQKLDREALRAALQARAADGTLSCADAFRLAEELGVRPRAVGQAADEAGVRLVRCQLGLFGYAPEKRAVTPAAEVPPELARAIEEGLILGRLPCAVAWALAQRFGIAKRDVADAAERLGIRIADCQLGAF